MTRKPPHISTTLIHHPYQPPEGYAAPQPGVFKASTVLFPNVAAMRSRYHDELGHQYTYGTKGTPTTFLLEERLCSLEGGSFCSLVPSGLAAITLTNFALLRSGDEMLIPYNVYGPSKTLADGELAHFGISYQTYDPMNPADLAVKISAKTKLVWLEVPGSVTMEFPNLPELVRICRAKNVLIALDNTWGAGLAFQPFDLGSAGETLGVDISVHALTKYPSGGGDVLMGSVMVQDTALHALIKRCHMRMGYSVGMNDIESVLRSLPSIALRYKAHDLAARALARWCQGRAEVVQVLHPALAASPGHENWRALCGGNDDTQAANVGHAAGLFSIMLHERYSSAQVDAFCDALKLFRLGYSWGGPMSLVVPYNLRGMRFLPHDAHLQRGTLVRFSVGLEALADLQTDLEQAMAATLA